MLHALFMHREGNKEYGVQEEAGTSAIAMKKQKRNPQAGHLARVHPVVIGTRATLIADVSRTDGVLSIGKLNAEHRDGFLPIPRLVDRHGPVADPDSSLSRTTGVVLARGVVV